MLINLRNALMSGAGLPYNAEVEYLESTGTQWIDTGVVPTVDTNVKLTYQTLITSGSNSNAFFGSRIRAQYSALAVLQYFSGGQVLRWDYGSSLTNILGVTNLSGVHTLSTVGNTIAYDGTVVATGGTFSASGVPMWLFAINNNGSALVPHKGLRVYSFQIYDANGVLVRDFIPVRKGTVGYLYDRVSGKLFGNAGTGDFVLGPDVVPVEYIESHGTEWIDTGVYGSQSLRTTFDYQLMYSGTAPVAEGLFGCYANGMKYYLYCSGVAPSYFQVGMGDGYINTILVDDVRHSIEFNNGTVSIDGNVVATFNPFEYPTAYTLLLFALRNSSGGLYSMTPMRKWRVQMWDNGTPVRSFYSVRVGTDATSWEGAMMDVLTRRIYRNAGTGAFGYGNDLKYPIPAE